MQLRKQSISAFYSSLVFCNFRLSAIRRGLFLFAKTSYLSAMTIQEQITALEEAMATGVKEVYTGDKRIVYRSLEEMRQAVARLQTQLNPPGPKRRVYPSFSKFPDESTR